MASCPNFPLHLSFSLSVCLVQCSQLLLQSLGFPHPSLPTIQVQWYNLDSILWLQQVSFFLAGFIAGFLRWSLSQRDTIHGRQVHHQENIWIFVFQEKREQAADAAAMKKDPDAYRAKMEAMEAARMRMQEKYNQVQRTVVLLIWCCVVN